MYYPKQIQRTEVSVRRLWLVHGARRTRSPASTTVLSPSSVTMASPSRIYQNLRPLCLSGVKGLSGVVTRTAKCPI